MVIGLLSVTYFGSAIVFDYYLRHGSWRRLKRWFIGYKNRISTKRLAWALLAYFIALGVTSFFTGGSFPAGVKRMSGDS